MTTDTSARLSILIRSASNLPVMDTFGKSDPFCKCRLGPLDSRWDRKDAKSERISPPIFRTLNPEFNFPIGYNYQDFHSDPSKLELHVRLIDCDLIGSDDFIGEVQIPLSELLASENVPQAYHLTNDGCPVRDAADNLSTLVILSGSDVELQVSHSIERHASSSTFGLWLNALQQYLSKTDDGIVYTTRMAELLMAGISSPTGHSDWFYKKADDDGMWEGPEDKGSLTYVNHRDVAERLQSLAPKMGTNNVDGSVESKNNLGFLTLTNVIWEELPEHSRVIGLGQSQENHAYTRSFIDQLIGSDGRWTTAQIAQAAQDFFNSRDQFSTKDLKIWTTIVLHKIHVDIDLSWDEASHYIDMQKKLLVAAVAPSNGIVNNLLVKKVIGLEGALQEKAEWINKYKAALIKLFPDELTTAPDEKVTLLASGVMDSLLFAGGLSVPTLLSMAVTLPYSKWLMDQLPDFQLTMSNINQYIMEIVRYFPPVLGFAYRERSFGSEPSKSIYLCLSSAQADKTVWGDDADNFKLRPMSTYAEFMLGWADRAVGKGKYQHNSRKCPGKDLSIVMASEFLKAFIATTLGEKCITKESTFDKSQWISDTVDDHIKVSRYGLTTITLAKNKTDSASS